LFPPRSFTLAPLCLCKFTFLMADALPGGTSLSQMSTSTTITPPPAWTVNATVRPTTLLPEHHVSTGNATITTVQYASGGQTQPVLLNLVLMGLPTANSTIHESSSSPTGHATGTSSPESPSPATNSRLEPGVIAGITIGCFFVGLIIGAIVTFLLRRRKPANPRSSPEPEPVAITTKPKSFGTSFASKDIQLRYFLLDTTPDREIAIELQSLSELIQLHIENNYHLLPVQSSPSILAESLLSLGFNRHPEADLEAIAAICINPRTRQLGLKHVISHVIFKSVDFHARSRLSMLPAPVAAFLQSVPQGGQDDGDVNALSVAFSKWRSLSAFLLHPRRSQRTPFLPADAAAAPQAQALVTALNTFLYPFIPPSQAAQRQQVDHLQAVVFECAKFGYMILSQPSDWQFVYETEAENSGTRMLVLCPGLNKLETADGERYESPHHVVAPLVSQV
ncbi:hypothetical protein CI238_03359, partial [Colletotrichum incanum]